LVAFPFGIKVSAFAKTANCSPIKLVWFISFWTWLKRIPYLDIVNWTFGEKEEEAFNSAMQSGDFSRVCLGAECFSFQTAQNYL